MRARRARRLVAGVVLFAQIALIVRAYTAPVAVFGFQMFPESSDWSVTVFRVTAAGERVDIRAEWPGAYAWARLVEGSGLENPFTRQPAAYGVDASLHFLQGALDWVASHTPADPDTAYLLAEVDLWSNGRGPARLVLISADRAAP